MPLQFKNIAVGNLQDDVSGNNYAANKAVYILNLSNTLAQIFSDEAGTIPIVQDGVNNVTNSKGVFGFWVEAGDYFVQVGANKYRVSITGADYFNNRIDETIDIIVDSVAGRGAYYPVGSFEAGFTYTDINQVGTFGGTDYYIYTGGLTNLSHPVPAGTNPTLSSDYAQVFYGEIDNVQGLREELDNRPPYLTLAEAQADDAPIGASYEIIDLNNYFLYVDSEEDPNGLTEISVGGGKSLFASQAQASFNITPVVFSSPVYSIPKNSIVSTSEVGESVVTFSDTSNNIKELKVSDLKISQPNDPSMSGGTANNHFCLALSGAHDGIIKDLFFNGVDLCVKTEYGASTLSDRSCKRINSSGLVGVNVVGMGYQSFGSQFCNIVDMTFNGDDGAGGRAIFHGLRVTAFDFAPNIGNRFSVISDNFTTGVSLQQYSNSNTIDVVANNCEIGAQIHGDAESVPSGAESFNNTINLTAKGCDRVCFSGSRGNTLNINADECDAGILDDNSSNPWLCRDNTYKGTVSNTIGRLIEVKGYKTKVDLKLIGVGAPTTHGAIVSGDSCTGILDIENCNTPASISGSGANLSLSVSNCTNPISVAGSDNVINVNTDGDLSVTGNNNVFIGSVRGDITNAGAGNDFSGLSGTSKSERLFSKSTNASGQLTVTHNLGFDNSSSITIFGPYTVSLLSSDQNSFTLTVYNVSDGTLAVSQTGLTLEYTVTARI